MKPMEGATQMFEQFSDKAIKTLSLWTDANQKIVRELATLSATSAKEGVELYGQLQASTLDAMKTGQAYWLRHQHDLPKWMGDPMGSFHAHLLEAMQEGQKGLKMFQDSVQAMVQTAEHIQAANEKATKGLQETYTTLATGVKEMVSPPPQA